MSDLRQLLGQPAAQPPPSTSTLEPYEPTLRELLGNAVFDGARWIGLGSIANRMRGDAGVAVDFVPGIGDALAVNDAREAYARSDYLSAIGGLGLAAIGAVPAAGDAAARGLRAFHGSPHRFDTFDIDDGAAWFAEHDTTAQAFGRDRMGLTPGVKNSAEPFMYEVEIGGNLKTIDPMREEIEAAAIAGIDYPEDAAWGDVMHTWGSQQKDMIDEARREGFDGVQFLNVGDDPIGSVSTHYAITNPDVVRIVRQYGLAALVGAGVIGATTAEHLRSAGFSDEPARS